MLKTAEGWHFDMAQAADEIQTREIGRNELSAIQAMHAYVDAQNEYYQHFQRYAKSCSVPGKKTVCTGQLNPAKSRARWGQPLAPSNRAKAITATVSALSTTVTSRRPPCWRGPLHGVKPA
jgi:hypothetical protein